MQAVSKGVRGDQLALDLGELRRIQQPPPRRASRPRRVNPLQEAKFQRMRDKRAAELEQARDEHAAEVEALGGRCECCGDDRGNPFLRVMQDPVPGRGGPRKVLCWDADACLSRKGDN